MGFFDRPVGAKYYSLHPVMIIYRNEEVTELLVHSVCNFYFTAL